MSEPEVPRHVFHYTQPSGLMGIAESRSFRATEASGLNDRDELIYGWTILPELVRRQGYADLASELEAARDDGERRDVFVTCASELADDAGQWDRYANGGRGYSLSINTYFKWCIRVNRAHPGPRSDFFNFWKVKPWNRVLYTEDDILGELSSWIPRTAAKYEEDEVRAKSAGSADDHHEYLFDQRMNLLASADDLIHRIKREGFSGEREFRLIAVTNDLDAIKYRESRYGLVRYVDIVNSAKSSIDDRILFDSEHPRELQVGAPPISGVRIGPAFDPEGDKTLANYLARNDIRAKVNTSAVSLR
ncbi:DUF2971 domain-containing protein [Brevibacterium sp. 239c]|uniref:DUF2971 domain-containing protein n=1 Tax=Brevibacterium sp. 239c TaxID=1965356 RepID=UPI001C6102A3|nr:DUF2971 domain-containing protein [Brevibacterium sp. 239c]